MLFGQRLHLKPGRNFFAFGLHLRLLDQIMQSLQLALGVDVWQMARVVIRYHLLDYASVTLARYIAARKVQESGVIRAAHELKDLDGVIGGRYQSITQIWVEVRESGAIDGQLALSLQT